MNIQIIMQHFDAPTLDRITRDLETYQRTLVAAAEAGRIADPTDRDNILRYLRDKKLPARPTSVEEIMKNFASSALSYSVVRRALGSRIGAIPTATTIGRALAVEFSEQRFLDDTSWQPASLKSLALDVATRQGLSPALLGGKTLASRVLGVLHDGASQMGAALAQGTDAYFTAVERHLTSPEAAWKMLEIFSKGIRQVGPGLMSDYMKNIGFHCFVKPDFHFLKQLPRLSGLEMKFSDRESFTLGWLLAEKLDMPAFTLDHTLYQWGRHGNAGAR